jgi:hypothetical protein
MEKRSTPLILLQRAIFLLILLPTIPALAEEVSLQVRAKSGRTEFHVGEPIELEMVYVASTPDRYEVDGSFRHPDPRSRDRILVEPEKGWVDPLEDYRKAMHTYQRFAFGPGRGGWAARRTGTKACAEHFLISSLPPLRTRFSLPSGAMLKAQP